MLHTSDLRRVLSNANSCNGLVQHTLVKLAGARLLCVGCQKKSSHDMHAVSYRIDASEHKDFRVHVACSPRHRHSLCLRSLHQSRSFLSLLSGIVLGCVGPKDAGKPLSWACHGQPACQFLQNVGPAPVSCSLLEFLIRNFQFDRCSLHLDLPL